MNMLLRLSPAALALAVVATPAPPACAQAAAKADALAWKFTPKTSYKFAFTEQNESKAEVQGQTIETKIDQGLDITWDIQAVDADGTATMTQTITRFKLKTTNPRQTMEFDTAQKEAPQGAAAMVAPVLQALVDQPIELKMTRRGEVKDVKIPAGMVEKMQAAGPAAQALPGLTTEDGLKRLMGRSGLVFPDKPVNQGTSWEIPDELPLPFGSMKVTKQFAYEGPTQEEGKTYEKIRSAVRVDEIKPNPQANLTVEVQKQKGGGQILFDRALGLVAKSDVTQNISLKLVVMNMDVVSVAQSRATLDLVK